MKVSIATFTIYHDQIRYEIMWYFGESQQSNAGIKKAEISIWRSGNCKMTFARELRASKTNAIEILKEHLHQLNVQ